MRVRVRGRRGDKTGGDDAQWRTLEGCVSISPPNTSPPPPPPPLLNSINHQIALRSPFEIRRHRYVEYLIEMAPSRPGVRNINGGVPDDTRSDASGPTSSSRHELPKPFAQTPSDKRRPAAIPAPVAPTPQIQSQQHQLQLQLQQQAQQHEIIEGVSHLPLLVASPDRA
ncbi:hypothetical protein H072_9014 [Dactylellina haptotyla CBS 200.50]|uniref:Uncharacterized protein n=1 Tax=Dactylellina haptotyla (strain CBS 200.50) TaxID=1284197 RepID=S8A2U7_DACHA|nr:hypothetical protein H072_9014 [Dactylellina haptotyla CBS 200.50]